MAYKKPTYIHTMLRSFRSLFTMTQTNFPYKFIVINAADNSFCSFAVHQTNATNVTSFIHIQRYAQIHAHIGTHQLSTITYTRISNYALFIVGFKTTFLIQELEKKNCYQILKADREKRKNVECE